MPGSSRITVQYGGALWRCSPIREGIHNNVHLFIVGNTLCPIPLHVAYTEVSGKIGIPVCYLYY